MIALYKYIRRLITSGGKELLNEKNMLAEEQMVMNCLTMNKFKLEIGWSILLVKEVDIQNNPKKG